KDSCLSCAEKGFSAQVVGPSPFQRTSMCVAAELIPWRGGSLPITSIVHSKFYPPDRFLLAS
ncbi:MAG: hypothetical protein KC931_02350, partial [Candidatus Omnitrophica bacterium]|nr:hypothetical protein [Candidatus Omnitrophota bacterium]